MQLAPTDTVPFTFAFWPTINTSKNRHRDGFLFSFHLSPPLLKDRQPFILDTSSCLLFSLLHCGFLELASEQIPQGNSLRIVLPQGHRQHQILWSPFAILACDPRLTL